MVCIPFCIKLFNNQKPSFMLMVHRTTEKELSEYAENASECIKNSEHSVQVGYSYGYVSIELIKQGESGVRRLETGLTMKEAAQWLSAFAQGCHYGKINITNPNWRWEDK